jgi:WD40 repeat protein
MNEPSWSGAFDSRNFQIAVGQDNGSKLIDVMTDNHLSLPSNKRTVISQAFYHDGNLLFCGRQDDDVGIIDLRMHNKIATVLHGSKSAGFVAPLKTDPNHLITETFSGAINKWDLRTLKPTLVFEGHSNHHNKVPCHIDSKERFLFAVDDGGTTRCWALNDGQLLCTIPRLDSPKKCSFFPRMVYSDNWGGQAGNSGLLLAHNKHFYMYDLFP